MSEQEKEWPKRDPVTNRLICRNCWSGIHRHVMVGVDKTTGRTRYKQSDSPRAEDACDGPCDCVHRSETVYAAEERNRESRARRERKKAKEEALAQSPLRRPA